jgi:hypothetical protein
VSVFIKPDRPATKRRNIDMTTASITHHPIPMAAAAAAAVAVLGVTGLVVLQDDTSTTAPAGTSHVTTTDQGNGKFHPPSGGGHVQLGLP